MEQGDSNSPSFIEEESGSAAAVKKPKKFPWLLVGAVVVVGAAALYFLVLKPTKYELTVTLGAGTTGTPATGKYKKGEVVPYSYSAQAGYAALQVMLDGAAVAAAGSVTMDKAHTITTSATQGAIMQVNSTPAGAKIYMNNADSGQVTPYTFNFNSAGAQNVLLRLCGYQDYSQAQSVVVGQTYTVNAALKPGIMDDFLVPSSCWKPHTASEWTISDGVYKFSSNKQFWNYSVYNTQFSQTRWTVEVKMKRAKGDNNNYNGIMLVEKMVGARAWGYMFFCYPPKGYWLIFRIGNYDIYSGHTQPMDLGVGYSAKINKALDNWNTLKVIRNDSQYTFYINDVNLRTVTDGLWNPHYLGLLMTVRGQATEMQYDYVKLDFSANAIDMSAPPCENVIPEINWLE
jgi:hypothetical protein